MTTRARHLTTIAAVAVVLLVAWWLSRSPAAPATTAHPATVTGVIAPHPRAATDPAVAAVRAVQMLAALPTMDATAARRVWTGLAATEAPPRLFTQLAEAQDPSAAVRLRAWYVAPLAVRLHPAGPAAARRTVEVWTVTTALVTDAPLLTGVFSTERVELVWQHGGWRVTGYVSTPGPTPAVAGTSTSTSDGAARLTGMIGVGR